MPSSTHSTEILRSITKTLRHQNDTVLQMCWDGHYGWKDLRTKLTAHERTLDMQAEILKLFRFKNFVVNIVDQVMKRKMDGCDVDGKKKNRMAASDGKSTHNGDHGHRNIIKDFEEYHEFRDMIIEFTKVMMQGVQDKRP